MNDLTNLFTLSRDDLAKMSEDGKVIYYSQICEIPVIIPHIIYGDSVVIVYKGFLCIDETFADHEKKFLIDRYKNEEPSAANPPFKNMVVKSYTQLRTVESQLEKAQQKVLELRRKLMLLKTNKMEIVINNPQIESYTVSGDKLTIMTKFLKGVNEAGDTYLGRFLIKMRLVTSDLSDHFRVYNMSRYDKCKDDDYAPHSHVRFIPRESINGVLIDTGACLGDFASWIQDAIYEKNWDYMAEGIIAFLCQINDEDMTDQPVNVYNKFVNNGHTGYERVELDEKGELKHVKY